MSYILDALQRADAERTRGDVPTLNARPIPSPPTQSGLNTQQRTGLAIAVATVLGAAATAWWWWPAPAPPPVLVAMPTIPVAPAPQLPLPAPMPASAASIAQAPAPQTAAVPVVPAAAIAPPTPARPPQAKPSASAPAAAAPLLAELPEATRRQIPAMAISGAVYSDNPAQRLLLVNGQVLNQGNQVAPDLTVVEIRSNISEFSFRGIRFRLAH